MRVVIVVVCHILKMFVLFHVSPLTTGRGKWVGLYFFFPNFGSIFRNAVTMNVMRQHTITMMKNF